MSNTKVYVGNCAGQISSFSCDGGDRRPTVLIAAFSSVLQEPPSRNTAQLLIENGWSTIVLQRDQRRYLGQPLAGAHSLVEAIRIPGRGRLSRVIEMIAFAIKLNRIVSSGGVDAFISVMLYPIGMLRANAITERCVSVCSIYDIPVLGAHGRVTERVYERAYRRLSSVDVVWASDACKAKLIKDRAALAREPLVCHNAPRADYLPPPLWPRDPWLRAEAGRQLGRTVDSNECLLLRAGALGVHGGIEETLQAMAAVTEKVIFILAGQITPSYRRNLEALAKHLGLASRFFVVPFPSDEVWRLALRGADVGHMIHLPPNDAYHRSSYELNSSLSNNRLFQYMAAGLPILTYDDPRLNTLVASTPCFETVGAVDVVSDVGGALRRLAQSASYRHSLGAAGRRAHETIFNWEAQFAPLDTFMNQRLERS